MSRSDLGLLYRRAGFGLTGAQLDALSGTPYSTAVQTLIAGLSAPDTLAPPAFTPFSRPADQAARMAQNRQFATELPSLQGWWLDQMVATTTPLQEKLTLFWHGHFATGVSKVRDPQLMYLQNHLFRTAGAGGFEALTQAVARDGAMMVWLDTATDVKAHPNENFAREMMELFTLGIGNYTQDDVTAAAGAFTGWAYDRQAYQYVFRPRLHDDSTKTYLGQTGHWNGTDIVHIAVNRPESAKFVMAKLWSHFAHPVSPSDPIVADLVSAYGPTLSVRSAMQAVFDHPAFLSTTTRTGLVKQPVEWLVGAARALDLNPSVIRPEMATELGQELFDPPNVGGWGQNGYWLDTATAEIRLRLAQRLAAQADLSALSSTATGSRVEYMAWWLGLDGWGATTAVALGQVASSPADLVALSLCSPEYVVA